MQDHIDWLMTMFTISRLARRFGLSRSTLLYYDRLELLRPSSRSAANYRLYSEQDAERLARILEYRNVGLPLDAIPPLLDAPAGSVATTLESRLTQINDEIHALRRQQQVLLKLIQGKGSRKLARSMDKAGWTALLRATGLSDEDMIRWHHEFEQAAPQAHQDFLESLGIEDKEIRRIREWSSRLVEK